MNFFLAIIPVLILAAIYISERVVYRTHQSGIILITGASSGIGRHAAEFLANNYKYTVLAGVRKEADANEITNLKIPNLRPLILDVTSHDSCVDGINSIKTIVKDTGLPFVALVNNAGVSSKMPVEYYDIEVARKMFDTNFFGVLELTQLSLPLLRESNGRIVMISSVAGLFARSYSSMYTASKWALEGFSDSLRREVAHFGISVSIVEPAFVKTPIFTTAAALKKDKAAQFTEEEKAVYAEFFSPAYDAKYDKIFDKADTAEVTTAVIVDAIVSPTPKTRYVVANANGIPAKVVGWLTWMTSDRLLDKLTGGMV